MSPNSMQFSSQPHQAAAVALGKSAKAAVAHANSGSSHKARSMPSQSPTGSSKPSRSPTRSRQPTPSVTPQQTSFPDVALDVSCGGSSPDSLAFESRYTYPASQRGLSPQRQGSPYGQPMHSPRSASEQDGAAQWWLSEAKRMRDEAMKVRTDRDCFRNALDDSHTEIKMLNTQVSESMAQLRHTQLALRESKSMADAARQELEQLRHWIDEAHTESRRSAAQLQGCEWQLRETRVTLENSEQSCLDLKHDNENKYAELVSLRKKVLQFEEKGGFKRAGKKFDQLEEQLAEAHDDAKKARQELESMRHQAQKSLEAERSQKEALRRQLQKYETGEDQSDSTHNLGVPMPPEGMQQSESPAPEGDGAEESKERGSGASSQGLTVRLEGSRSEEKLPTRSPKAATSALRRTVKSLPGSPRVSIHEGAQRRNQRRLKTSDTVDFSSVDLSSVLEGLSAEGLNSS